MKAAVEMDRIQKTLEIVRDSVPGEMTADSRMARSLAADAIARARCKHQRQLIDKLAEADDECLAELREHWYSMREDIERDYKAGMIDQETYERLSGLWAERLEDGIRRRKYEDDYTQILDKVGMAVRDLQTSCADDYNRIAELWQEPRKQRKPRRVGQRTASRRRKCAYSGLWQSDKLEVKPIIHHAYHIHTRFPLHPRHGN